MFYRLQAFVFLLVVVFFAPALTFAQETAGIGIGPSLIEKAVDPGSSFTDVITVKNLGSGEETYYMYSRDISSVTDGGRPIYAEEGLPDVGFEMSNWISISATSITVPSGEQRDVTIVVDVPADASPGSHFSAIFASKTAPDQVDLGAGVGFQVANIVTVRVAGDVIEKVDIRAFETDRFVYGSKAVEFTAKLENKGNVLVRPIGPVEVTNMFGTKVETLIINETKNGLFPMSNRDYKVVWEDASLGFGKYTATLGLVYGEAGKSQTTISAVTSFWVLPWVLIKPLLIGLTVIFLVSYFVIRHLIRAQVQKLSGGRRLVHRTGSDAPSVFVLLTIVMLVVTALALFVLLLLFA